MTYSVQFSVRPVPGEFEFSYEILDKSVPDDQATFVMMYPSQAELQDDLRHAHLPVSLSIVGKHPPIEASDEQLSALRRNAEQDYK